MRNSSVLSRVDDDDKDYRIPQTGNTKNGATIEDDCEDTRTAAPVDDGKEEDLESRDDSDSALLKSPPVMFAAVPASLKSHSGRHRSGFTTEMVSNNKVLNAVPASVHRRSKRSTRSAASSPRSAALPGEPRRSDIRRQRELEAALDHSKAKEALLLEEIIALRDELAIYRRQDTDRHSVLRTLEKEHRQMKANFRDLMEVSLSRVPECSSPASSFGHPQLLESGAAIGGADAQAPGTLAPSAEAPHLSTGATASSGLALSGSATSSSCSTVSSFVGYHSTTSSVTRPSSGRGVAKGSSQPGGGTPDVEMMAAETGSSDASATLGQQLNQGFDADQIWPSPRRCKSVPHSPNHGLSGSATPSGSRLRRSSEPALDAVGDLQWRLRQTEELLESLRGTNGYARKVLQRNSQLEQRLEELVAARDATIREACAELQAARSQRMEMERSNEELRRDLQNERQKLFALHNELRSLHEQRRQQRRTDLELAETVTKLEETQERLQNESVAHAQLRQEWQSEKAHLENEIALHRGVLSSSSTQRGDGDDAGESSDAKRLLLVRIVELEDLLAKSREAGHETKARLEQELQSTKDILRNTRSQFQKLETNFAEVTEKAAHDRASVERLETDAEAQKRELNALLATKTETMALQCQLEDARRALSLEQERAKAQSEQISRNVETIREAHERFIHLLKRNNILDQLLQRQRVEREKLASENLKVNETMASQINTYRSKLDAMKGVIATLKQKLREQETASGESVVALETLHQRQIKAIRAEVASEKRAVNDLWKDRLQKLRNEALPALSAMQERHAQQLDAAAKQYETHITELKSLHERRLADMQAARDEAVKKARDDAQRQVAEMSNLLAERRRADRAQLTHDAEAQAQSVEQEVARRLGERNTELESLRRALDAARSEAAKSATAAAAMETRLAQVHQAEIKEIRFAASLELDRERVAHVTALQAQATAAEEQRITFEERMNQELQLVERKVSILEEARAADRSTVATLQSELDTAKRAAIAAEGELETLRADLSCSVTTVQERDAKMEELQREISQLQTATKRFGNLAASPETQSEAEEDFKEKIAAMTLENEQIKIRLSAEIADLKSVNEAQAERLLALETASGHTENVLVRNAELEHTTAKEIEALNGCISELEEQLAATRKDASEAVAAKVKTEKEFEAALSSLKKRSSEVSSLCSQLEQLKADNSRLQDLEKRLADKTRAIEGLQSRLETAQRSGTELPETIARQRKTIQLLTEQLEEASAEIKQLNTARDQLKDAALDASKRSMDVSLLKIQLANQGHTIEILTQRIDRKQALIDTLTSDLAALKASAVSPGSGDDAGTREDDCGDKNRNRANTTELQAKCQKLEDALLGLEHEKRSLEHMIEVERQLASHNLDNKERQLEQLLETNRRAEKLLARNAELEEMVMRLTNELDRARIPTSSTRGSTDDPAVQSPTADGNNIGTDARSLEESRRELEAALEALERSNKEISQLGKKVRELELQRELEMCEMQSKLRLATFQGAMNNSSVGNSSSLLKELVERTSALQSEVSRLQAERDASIGSLQEENTNLRQRLMELAQVSTHRVSTVDNEKASLAAKEVTLDGEAGSISDTVASVPNLYQSSTSTSTSWELEIAALRTRNADLQASIDRLQRVVEEQASTLDFLGRHADEALRQNGTLGDISSELKRLGDGSRHVKLFSELVRRKTELEAVLRLLRKQDREIHLTLESRKQPQNQRSTTESADSSGAVETANLKASGTASWKNHRASLEQLQTRLANTRNQIVELEKTTSGTGTRVHNVYSPPGQETSFALFDGLAESSSRVNEYSTPSTGVSFHSRSAGNSSSAYTADSLESTSTSYDRLCLQDQPFGARKRKRMFEVTGTQGDGTELDASSQNI